MGGVGSVQGGAQLQVIDADKTPNFSVEIFEKKNSFLRKNDRFWSDLQV